MRKHESVELPRNALARPPLQSRASSRRRLSRLSAAIVAAEIIRRRRLSLLCRPALSPRDRRSDRLADFTLQLRSVQVGQSKSYRRSFAEAVKPPAQPARIRNERRAQRYLKSRYSILNLSLSLSLSLSRESATSRCAGEKRNWRPNRAISD